MTSVTAAERLGILAGIVACEGFVHTVEGEVLPSVAHGPEVGPDLAAGGGLVADEGQAVGEGLVAVTVEIQTVEDVAVSH